MNPRISEKEWLEDFKDFVETKGTSVPQVLSQKILSYVDRDLNPSAWIVFFKLLGIHSVVGTLSLAICDQFGMSPFDHGFSLTQYFMKFGYSFCMMMCGFLFLGLTGAFSYLILKRQEFLILKKNVLIQVFFLSVLSLASFLAFGVELVLTATLLWLVGALLGGAISIQLMSTKLLNQTN